MIATILVALNYFAVAAFFFVRKRKRAFILLDPAWAFLGGYFINYCIRPTLYLIDPEIATPYKDALNTATAVRSGLPGSLVFALFGLLGFAIGDLCCNRLATQVSRWLPTPSLGSVTKYRSYSLVAYLFLAIGFAGLWGFIHESGWSGSPLDLLTGIYRDTFLRVILGHGYYTFAMQLSIVGWTLLCARWIVYPKVRQGWRRVGHAAWRFCLLVVSLLIWVAFGERSAILTVLFVPFAISVTLKSLTANDASRRILRRRALLLALMFVMIAGPVGVLMSQQDVTGPLILSMTISAWDTMEFTVAAIDHLHFRDLFWGTTYISDIAYTWYPRAIFSGKPEWYGVVLIQDKLAPGFADSTIATFPPGILVEAYANFWYVGLFVVPFLLAVFCRAIYLRLQVGDYFWLVQMPLFFPQLASFRSLGWLISALILNLFVVGFVVVICRLARAFAVSPVRPPVMVKS